jgi:hypothetical protein
MSAKGKDVGWSVFVDGTLEPVPSWEEAAPHPLSAEIRLMIRRIEKLIDHKLKGLDFVLCWFAKWIHPLQTRDHLLHEYTGDKADSLWVTNADLPRDALEHRLKKMVKVRDKNMDFSFSHDIYLNGKCPKVKKLLLIWLTFFIIGDFL